MVDIVEAVTGVFGAAEQQRLATAFNVAPPVVDRLLAAGIPALLAGILGRTREPGGAKLLASVLDRQPEKLSDNIAGLIGAPGRTGVIEDGITATGSLLGSTRIGELAGILSKFSRTGMGNARNALGLVMSVILSVLQQERSARRLDANGLARYLASQQQAVSSAVPPTLRPLLDGIGLLADLDADRVSDVGRDDDDHAHVVENVGDDAKSPSGIEAEFHWPAWLLAIAAASAIWWSVFGGRVTAMFTGVPPPTIGRFLTAPEHLYVGDADIGKEAVETLAHLHGLLTGIRGDLTARLSLPKLNESIAALDRIRNLSSQLTPERRRQFSALIASRTAAMTAAAVTAQSAPGAAPVLAPALEQLRGRLAALAK